MTWRPFRLGMRSVVKGIVGVMVLLWFLGAGSWVVSAHQDFDTSKVFYLQRATVYLAAGDYRRAIEACQHHLDAHPSVEGYVYLAYVYQALEGYLDYLAQQDEWVKIGQLSLNLTSRNVLDLIDPPNVLPRMAREIIHEGIQQQFDVTAAMANRLDRKRTDQLWVQQTAWRQAQPDRWWAGIPKTWNWSRETETR